MKRVISLGLILTMVCAMFTFMPASASSADSAKEYDIFDNGYIRGSCYRNSETLFYNIDEMRDFDGEIYAALYDNDGNLIETKVGETTGSFDGLQDKDYKIKVYLWNENQSPLCEPLVMNSSSDNTEYVVGHVVANSVTDLIGPLMPKDSFNRIIVEVDYYSGTDWKYDTGLRYEFNLTTDAADYLGYKVAFNIPNAQSSDPYEVAEITSVMPFENTTLTFAPEQFVYYDNNYGTRGNIFFMNNDYDTLPTKASLDPDGAYVMYNGICGYDIYSMFAPQEDSENPLYMITANSPYCGNITMVDNNATVGYDIIIVNIESVAVIDQITPNGLVSFKNTVGSRMMNNYCNRIELASNSSAKIKLTKNGRPYDYTQLKEWDVLSIVANTSAYYGYYDIEVLGDDSIVRGTITEIIPGNTQTYRIDEKLYRLSPDVYSPFVLREWVSGNFYLNRMGRITAFLKDNDSVDYAYILNAELVQSFGATIPTIQILYRNGTVTDAMFDEVVFVTNPTAAFGGIEGDQYTTYFYRNQMPDEVGAALDSIVGSVVELTTKDGYLKALTLPSTASDPFDPLKVAADADNFEYNQYKNDLKIGSSSLSLADDAVVFFIGRPGDTYKYKEPAVDFQNMQGPIDPQKGEVVRGSELLSFSGSGEKQAAAYTYINGDETADAVVIYNSENTADPNIKPPHETELMSDIAFIDSVGVEGKTVRVSYYQSGELKTAATASNFSSEYLNADTPPGTLLKLDITSGIITGAEPILTFNGDVLPDVIRDAINGSDYEWGVPRLSHIQGSESGTVIFGALVGKNKKKLYVAPMLPGDTLPDFSNVTEYTAYSETDELYVYDAAAVSSKCGIGYIGDIYIDPYLAGDNGKPSQYPYEIFLNGLNMGNSPVAGMLDYIYIFDNGESACMVLYMRPAYVYSIY